MVASDVGGVVNCTCKRVNPVSLRLLHPTLGPSCTIVHVQLYRRCLVVTDLAVSSPPGHDLIQRAHTSTEVPCCPEPFFLCDVDKHLPLSSWSNGAVSGAAFHLSWHTGTEPHWLFLRPAMWPAMPKTGKDWSAVVCRIRTDTFQRLSRHWGRLVLIRLTTLRQLGRRIATVTGERRTFWATCWSCH